MTRLCLAVLTAGMISALTGCHGREGLSAFEIPEKMDTSGEYEITFWAKNDTNKTQTAIYEQAIAGFEELYPNITVNLRLYTDYGKIYNDVITNITTGTTPNVCITYPDHIATYLTGSNLVVPLEELFVDDRYGLAEVKCVSMHRLKRRSFRSFWRNVLLAAIITRCRICALRRPVISIRPMWRRLDIRCRMP